MYSISSGRLRVVPRAAGAIVHVPPGDASGPLNGIQEVDGSIPFSSTNTVAVAGAPAPAARASSLDYLGRLLAPRAEARAFPA